MSLQSLRIRGVRLYFFVLNIVGTVSETNVFYGCRDNPIQYASKFSFNCSNPNEVIYVVSAIIGFTPLYKADRNVFECPVTSDTCTKTIPVPSTLCDGHIECILAQRMLLYNESGLQCRANGTGDHRGGNFINVNYSCIARELCTSLPGYNGRYTCSPKTTTSSSDGSISMKLFPVTGNTPSMATILSLPSQTQGNTGTRQSTQISLSPIIMYGHSLSAGAISGIVIGAVILTIIVAALTILLLRRKKRLKYICKEPERPATSLQQTFSQETVIGLAQNNSNNIINSSNLTAYDQAATVVRHTKTATRTPKPRNIKTPESKGTGNSHQRSIDENEMVGNVNNYDTVRSSSTPVNANCSGNETVANAVNKNNPATAAYNIAGASSSCQVPSRTTPKDEPVAHKRKINDNAAETEYAELRGVVSNHSSPPPRRNDSERDYYNYTAVGMKEKVPGEIVENDAGNQNHDDDGEYVDWGPESECAYGEVILVDNALYAEDISV